MEDAQDFLLPKDCSDSSPGILSAVRCKARRMLLVQFKAAFKQVQWKKFPTVEAFMVK